MQFVVLGWADGGPTLRLDYRRFAYAGKFAMSSTGKAVVVDRWDATSVPAPEYDRGVVAAAAFNADRTDDSTLWIRYVTVRSDRKGETLGPRLCAFVVEAARGAGYDAVRIAVNNPFAYEALHKAGFAWTGETTGIAELVLERPADAPAARTRETYQAGLDRYRGRDDDDPEASFLASRTGTGPPELVAEARPDAPAAGGGETEHCGLDDTGVDTGR